MEINRVMLLGNLTQDPETRYLQSGTAVSKLRLASSRRYRDRSGEQREDTLFINVDVWGRQAETCQEYLRKGSEILVEGRLRLNTFQTQEGQNRSEILISADRIQFGRRSGQPGSGEGQEPAGGGSYGRGGGSTNAPQRSAAPRDREIDSQPPSWDSSPSAPDDYGDGSGGTDNDLPF